tara:strand:+ start:588 stop:1214 length:627 start_codon:yes stop_codon:yes gene_type:complete
VNTLTYWENIYASKNFNEVSWFQSRPTQSIDLINRSGISKKSNIIDIGGGASSLPEELLVLGFERLTVLDISYNAIEKSQNRMGKKSKQVQWIHGDVLETDLPVQFFDLWHDRAAMHFLTSVDDRKVYRSKILASLKPGGFLAIHTFAEDGPDSCSGLQVQRFSIETLTHELGVNFSLVVGQKHSHITPGGMEQRFLACLFQLASTHE